MAHMTALLVVLTLAGEPAANALCINWCDLPSERQGCSEPIAASSSVVQSNPARTCVALLTGRPFIREEVRNALHLDAMIHGVLANGISWTREMSRANVTRNGDANGGQPAPTRVLRL